MALAQCPRSGGSIPSGGLVSSRDGGARAQVLLAAVYISRDDSALSGAVLFPCPLTGAARDDARRRPASRRAEDTHPADGRPLILIRLS